MDKKSVETSVKNEELIRKRRDQMVKAAVKLFTEKGFHRTTTREIAKASGFSIGTLYEYIRSKDDVLYLVCDDIYRQVNTRIKEKIDVKGDGLACLKDAIATYIKIVDEMRSEMLVMYQEAKSLSKESLPYVLNKELEMAGVFEDILGLCVQSGQIGLAEPEVRFFAQHIIVQCQMWTFRRWALRGYTLEEFTQMQINAIMGGLTSINKAELSV
ncbi:TetR family transcriptional regulator [Scopulibacillus darangshiensis]|uniref:TetR family transcriptional regulator n=1 Tax=Scopulibacillus darangshiensis TaxID=442528 RepID=A0A4R2NMU7_9BACL|nr:TetR/AcrR family transcriptional regulator [Scopulibacillus darangshiensis]TCP23009.1 TetR family transcriptional regulator [Scopulibacillus darangshiensis]